MNTEKLKEWLEKNRELVRFCQPSLLTELVLLIADTLVEEKVDNHT